MWVVFNGVDVVFERSSESECVQYVIDVNVARNSSSDSQMQVIPKGFVPQHALDRWHRLRDERKLSGSLIMLHPHECQLGHIASRRMRSEHVNTLVETLVESLVEDLRVTLHDRLTEMLLKEPLEEFAVG